MNHIITILIVLIAIEHFYFLVLEMFLWTTKKGIRAFNLKSEDFAEDTKILAANQGLYNGFLAAGLIYSVINLNENWSIFFLICIIVAGIYGAYSTKQIKLFYVQAAPAIAAFGLIVIKNLQFV